MNQIEMAVHPEKGDRSSSLVNFGVTIKTPEHGEYSTVLYVRKDYSIFANLAESIDYYFSDYVGDCGCHQTR